MKNRYKIRFFWSFRRRKNATHTVLAKSLRGAQLIARRLAFGVEGITGIEVMTPTGDVALYSFLFKKWGYL